MLEAGANEKPALPKFHLISLNVNSTFASQSLFFKASDRKKCQFAQGILLSLKYYKKWNILFIPHQTDSKSPLKVHRCFDRN
jgi:hypothetical protein